MIWTRFISYSLRLKQPHDCLSLIDSEYISNERNDIDVIPIVMEKMLRRA